MILKNEIFKDQDIVLDGNTFTECTFTNCRLSYSGVLPVSMVSNRFDNCKWGFLGPAAATLNFMTALYHGGGKEIIEATFSNIRAIPKRQT